METEECRGGPAGKRRGGDSSGGLRQASGWTEAEPGSSFRPRPEPGRGASATTHLEVVAYRGNTERGLRGIGRPGVWASSHHALFLSVGHKCHLAIP